jgi:hypothetical protein
MSKLNAFEKEILEMYFQFDDEMKKSIQEDMKPYYEKLIGRKLKTYEVIFIVVNRGIETAQKMMKKE